MPRIIRLFKYFLFFACCSFIAKAFAQFEKTENVWVWGDSTAIDFNGVTPVKSNSHMSAFEAAASVCDPNGQLLFYTQGHHIWDRNHNLMPNGSAILPIGWPPEPTRSSAQGAIIVPIPGTNHSKYYVFSNTETTGATPRSAAGRLYYSLVDMSLNGGLGDVDTAKKGILLDSNLSERMITIAGQDCNTWLIVASRPTEPQFRYKAYEINAQGVNTTPIISIVPPYSSPIENHGAIIAKSPLRNKIATCEYFNQSLRVYDFDPSTGEIANPIEIPFRAISICFSPDGTKLYAANSPELAITQFDLTTASATAIVNSETPITGASGLMKLQPSTNKIYAMDANIVNVIHSPNMPAAACELESNLLVLPSDPNGYPPNIVTHPVIRDTIITSTLVSGTCATLEEGGEVTLYTSIPGLYYSWDNGDTGSQRTVTTDGFFWVSYVKDCTYYIDSFQVKFLRLSIEKKSTCINDSSGKATITPDSSTDTNTYSFIWLDSNKDTVTKGPHLENVPPGTYYVHVYTDSCSKIFPVDIEALADSMKFKKIWPEDTLIKYGESVKIITESDAVRWNWFPTTYLDNAQSKAPISKPEAPIVYQVIGYGPEGCNDTGTVKIRIDYASNIKVPSAFSPNGDGLNDEFKIYLHQYEKLIAFKVFNRWGNLVFETNNINRGWNGYFKGQPAPSDVYMYYIEVLLPGPDGGEIQTLKGDVSLIR